MTSKADQWIYILKTNAKKPKRIKLRKFLKEINSVSFSQQFFVNEKDVYKYKGEINAST